MATQNILHDYGAYTYHFVLIASKETKAFDALDSLTNDTLDKWAHPEERYAVKSIAGADYVIIHNSMTDSDFSISQFNCKHIVNTGFKLGVDASMVVFEPLTIDFIGSLAEAAKSLGSTTPINSSTLSVNITPLRFGLKIIFTGYKTQRNNISAPSIITKMDTFKFMIGNLEMDFTERGAEYRIKCNPLPNTPFSSYISFAGSRTLSLRLPVDSAISDLEKYINDEANAQAKLNNKPTYDIKLSLDPYYKDKKFVIDNVTADNLNKITTTPKKNPDTTSNTPNTTVSEKSNINNTDAVSNSEVYLQYAVSNKDNVHDIIQNLLLKSTELTKDINTKNIHPKICGDLATEKNKDTYTFHIIPVDNNKEKADYYLEYDYYYAGKNVDVINFKINLPISLSVAGGNTTYHIQPHTINDNTKLNDVNKSLNNPPNNEASKSPANINQPTYMSGFKIDTSDYAPLAFISDYLEDSNSKNPSEIYNARAGLNKTINMQSFKATLDIIGNPDILQKLINETQHYVSKLLITKVNVRAPKPKYMQNPGEYYSTPFLNLKNGYIVQDITSNFVGGKFTQSLNLTSYIESTDNKGLESTVQECTISDANTTTVPNENITSQAASSADNLTTGNLYGAFAAPITGTGIVAEEFIKKNSDNPQTLAEMAAAQKENPMSKAVEQNQTQQGNELPTGYSIVSDFVNKPK